MHFLNSNFPMWILTNVWNVLDYFQKFDHFYLIPVSQPSLFYQDRNGNMWNIDVTRIYKTKSMCIAYMYVCMLYVLDYLDI